MKNKDKENQQIIDSYDYIGNSASSQECTGLIPSAIQDESELDSYQKIQHFSVPRSKEALARGKKRTK